MNPAPSTDASATPSRSQIRPANTAWEALLQAHASLMGVYAAESMWTEVSMREYDVLYTLAKSPSPLRLSELRDGVLLSQPALSRMVDRLITRELVSREADPQDARAVRISLTDQGRRVQRRVGRAHARSVAREVGSALNDEEIAQLDELCRKLAARKTPGPGYQS